MCTAVCYRRSASYFGRNLDLSHGYGEGVVITPRNYKINMLFERAVVSHYAFIGMACVFGKVKSRYAKSPFVSSLVVKRKVIENASHTNKCIV